jgi:hypothetical protein
MHNIFGTMQEIDRRGKLSENAENVGKIDFATIEVSK